MSIIEKAMEKARKNANRQKMRLSAQLPPDIGAYTDEERRQKEALRDIRVTDGIEVRPVPELIMARSADLSQGGEYRLLKEYLLALRKYQPALNMFMITSAMRNEGKTMVSCNLSATLAHEFDHTVLLIDADLRAPSCHRMLGITRPRGVCDCLLRGSPISEVLIHTGLGKLALLGAGDPIDNPAELFTSSIMRDFLFELKHRYSDRIIIIDTPPLLPFAETRALSRLVDGVILVARENVTAKNHLDAALRTLEGTPLLGVVYNDTVSYGTDKEIYETPYNYGSA